jgi:predicted dinucleotide-binding enzyme
MKITVFGSGVVGQTIAEKLADLGHEVTIGTRNVKDALARSGPDNFGRPAFKEWLAQHPKVKLGTHADAAAAGSFLINATNGEGSLPTLEQAGKKNLANKVLLDIANPLDFSKGMPPTLFVCNTDSLGEQIQRAYPETKVVKGLNTMTAYIMVNPALLPEDHNVFLSGNDSGAKSEVVTLLQSFGWKERNIIDMGDITTARGTEQLVAIWVRLYGALKNPMFNFKIVTAPHS